MWFRGERVFAQKVDWQEGEKERRGCRVLADVSPSQVRVAFDYEKPARDGDDQPPRKFYSVYLQGKHVPLLMVEQGLGQVSQGGKRGWSLLLTFSR